MATPTPLLLVLLLSLLLRSFAAPPPGEDTLLDGEGLGYVEQPSDLHSPAIDPLADEGEYGSFDEFLELDSSQSQKPGFDEKDVVVLNGSNFDEFVLKNRYAVVEFYEPWCSHCQVLAPEYAASATELKGEGEGEGGVVVAKVDATEEAELANKYGVDGYPTILLFVDGEHRVYNGARNKDAIVTWVRSKTSPSIRNITTIEEAEQIVNSESRMVVAFLDSLKGANSKELEAASRVEEDISFYQTASSDVAKVFQIDPNGIRPTLVLLKEHEEKLSRFDGPFSKSHIAEFVSFNKAPHVINFTKESSSLVFDNPIKKQILLFATSNDSAKLIPLFREAAKAFKGKLIFVYVDMENEDHGKPIANYFGVTGNTPRVLAYTGNEDGKKFLLDGDLTEESIKSFGKDFVDDLLIPVYKSDPIPEKNDGDVKIVVGKNLDDIVLDESKDVLLEVVISVSFDTVKALLLL
ncbi:Protein disulfide isomerase-like [Dionaea muscipula]